MIHAYEYQTLPLRTNNLIIEKNQNHYRNAKSIIFFLI